jgi:hypothetical protein
VSGKTGLSAARDCYQFYLKLFDNIYQADNFVRFTAVTQHNHDIVFSQPSQIAVHRLGRMKKMARRSGRSERSADFLTDDARFSDARNYNRAFTVVYKLRGTRKGVIYKICHLHYALCLGIYHLPCVFKVEGH